MNLFISQAGFFEQDDIAEIVDNIQELFGETISIKENPTVKQLAELVIPDNLNKSVETNMLLEIESYFCGLVLVAEPADISNCEEVEALKYL